MSTPTLTELAAPVLLMAEAFTSHMVHLHTDTTENVAALVAFKRALKEAEAPTPTAHDALIAEALSERTEKMISHLRFQKEKNPNSVTWEGECVLELADALTTEPYRHALEQRLIGSNLPGLTGDADADLMRFVLHEQEIAGYFCGQLEKDLTAERAARVAAEKASIGCLSERDLWCREARAAYDRRDAAIARAERAERKRDEAQIACGQAMGATNGLKPSIDEEWSVLGEAVATLYADRVAVGMELERLIGGLYDIAEGDCSYGDNCPGGQSGKHGQCHVCHCREVLGITAEQALTLGGPRYVARAAAVEREAETRKHCDAARAAREAFENDVDTLTAERDAAIARAERAEASEKRFSDEVSAAFRKHGLAAGPNAIDGLVRDLDTLRELNQVNEKLERELAGLGPVEYVVNTDAHGWRLTHCAEYEHVRSLIPDNALAIRRVLPAKEAK